MAASVTTLSSAGVSPGVLFNPVPKSTTIQVTVASGSSGSATFVQYTLDDPTVPGTTITWANLSSAIVSSNTDAVGSGSSVGSGGVTYTMLSPIGGLRLSSSGTVTGTVTLKALQSVTA